MSGNKEGMMVEKLPHFSRIIADGDLDGLIAAAIIKSHSPNAEVHFVHAAEIRSGMLENIIDKETAICDLPFHPNCGMYLDHHLTNKPHNSEIIEFTNSGSIFLWEDKPSAARVAFDLYKDNCELGHLEEMMPMVDALDSGQISKEQYLSDNPIQWLSRTISLEDKVYTHQILNWICNGKSVDEILSQAIVQEKISERRNKMDLMKKLLKTKARIEDRLAIVRLDDTGLRTNGYLVTAFFGEDCDACCIVHGNTGGVIGDHSNPPLSTSFYTNSFLHRTNGLFDLTKLAKLYDDTGGGHANACGCRIQALDHNLELEERQIASSDIELNITGWLELWKTK